VVGRPVVFASTGEKMGDFDLFHPDRMASRILGMGDILTLIEQAERTIDPEVAADSASRMLSGQFTLDDFMAQLNQVRKMGSLGGLMKLMPGMTKDMRDAAKNVDDSQLDRIEAIVRSMTAKERRDPSIIDGSRRTRIAKGCGRSVNDVNQLLKQFDQMKKMMKTLGRGGMPQLPGGMGKLGAMAGKMAQARGQELPAGFEALGQGMRAGTPPNLGGNGPKGKKKKGGRVTPPKNR